MNFMANNGIIRYGAIGEKKIRTVDDTELISVQTAKSGFYDALVFLLGCFAGYVSSEYSSSPLFRTETECPFCPLLYDKIFKQG